MPINFNATADKVARTGTLVGTTGWSVYGWFRRASTTGGEFFSHSSGTAEIVGIYWSNSTTDRLTIDRCNSAGALASQWTVTQANLGITLSASKWFFLAITQTGTSTPIVYTMDPSASPVLGSRTVSTAVGPGTPDTTNARSIYFGNWVAADYGLTGDMAWWGYHNVVLTLGELYEAAWRGMTTRGLVVASPLESSSVLTDLSGSPATLTGTGLADVSSAPPVTPLWVPTLDGWAPHTVSTVTGSVSVPVTFDVTVSATVTQVAVPIFFDVTIEASTIIETTGIDIPVDVTVDIASAFTQLVFEPEITYGIEVQWNNERGATSLIIGSGTIGSGTVGGDTLWNPLDATWDGAYDDVTDRCLRFQIDSGRSSKADVAFSSRAEIELHDPDGLFNPENTSSPLAGSLLPTRVVRITATHGTVTQTLFRGVIRRLAHRPSPNAGAYSKSVLTCEDVFMLLDRKEARADVYTGRVDELMDRLLEVGRIPLYLRQLEATYAHDVTLDTIETDAPRILSELRALAESERGQLYVNRQGTVVYDAREHRAGTALPATAGTIDSMSASITPSTSLDTILNRATVQAGGQGFHPQTVDDSTSQEYYGVADYQLTSNYIVSDAHARDVATFIVSLNADPADELQAVELVGGDTPSILAMLALDINDLVRVMDPVAGIDGLYWVEGLAHESETKMGGHHTRVTLSKAKTGLPQYDG